MAGDGGQIPVGWIEGAEEFDELGIDLTQERRAEDGFGAGKFFSHGKSAGQPVGKSARKEEFIITGGWDGWGRRGCSCSPVDPEDSR